MLFFNTKKKIIDTGILKGSTDWHSHILPGVDDGIQTMEDSLAVLAYYEKIGISDVWLTPHIMEDMPNTPEELRARFQELTEAYQGPVKLHLAAENMMDNLFNERLAANNLLPIGMKGDHLLVETSYFQPPIDLRGTLKRIQELGYQPILAHPERYRYMDDSDYDYLVTKGVKLQLNIISLAGGYGKPAQDKALMLLSKGYYKFFGSDLHRLSHFTDAINSKALKKETAELLPGIQNIIM
ncbi:MAG: capsular biosynthesis protein [Bacteroidaceae bacterium]|nr:capsular biosynthesis protein [Bacteroidaceae bacterium]